MINLIKRWGFLLGLLVISHPVFCGEGAIDDVLVSAPLAGQIIQPQQLAFYVDSDGQSKFGDVLLQWQQGNFESGVSEASRSISASTMYWLRFVLVNTSSRTQSLVLTAGGAQIDRVSLYIPDYKSRLLHRQAGDAQVWTPGKIRARLPVFAFELASGARLPVYLRSDDLAKLRSNLEIWSPDRFLQRESRLTVMFGVLFGGLFVLVICMLVIYSAGRDRVVAIFAAYVLAAVSCVSLIYGLPSLWMSERLIPMVNTLMAISAGLTLGFGLLFYRRYLRLALRSEIADSVICVMQWFAFSMVLSPVLPMLLQCILVTFAVGVAPAVTIVYVYFLWLRGWSNVGIFTVGWSLLCADVLLMSLQLTGLLSLHGWKSDVLLWGGFVSILTLCWALMRDGVRAQLLDATKSMGAEASLRCFMDVANSEYGRAARFGRALSVVVVEIDGFSDIVASAGPSYGRKARQAVITLLADLSQASDTVADVGVGRFYMLLIETDSEHAVSLVQKLCNAQAQRKDVFKQQITTSFGVASIGEGDVSVADTVARAKAALDTARMRGVGQVQVYEAMAEKQ